MNAGQRGASGGLHLPASLAHRLRLTLIERKASRSPNLQLLSLARRRAAPAVAIASSGGCGGGGGGRDGGGHFGEASGAAAAVRWE